ncbi:MULTISPECIES: transcriptional regulator GcvA [Alphaproteobacteria]|uniref:transcriptional regulator GcvA n=1 Tax=Alphaproteobacteria TaxID=28211 RepID=UPI00326335ED
MNDRRMPPLNALRAFEAAARHLSLKEAADELCVTPGAISQSIKTLEQALGIELFQRANRAIFLTDAGQTYLPQVRNAFRQINTATDQILSSAETGILALSTTTCFASAWLIPRLDDFRETCPEIDLHIRTGNSLTDLTRGAADVAIRHGKGRYTGLVSEQLFSVEKKIAVAAPSLTERLASADCVRDLLDWPLLHDSDRIDWGQWFEAQGVSDFDAVRGLAFEDSGVLLYAALAGQGAALIPSAMAQRELERGALVRLVGVPQASPFTYHLVYPESSAERPKIRAFRHWVYRAAGDKKHAN